VRSTYLRPGRLLLLALGAAAALAARAHAADLTAASFVCSGNEPFWHIEMNSASAVLTRPGMHEIEEHVFAGRLDAFDYLDPPWSIWRGHEIDANGGDLVVVVRKETCLDTMADDVVFDHRALVSFPEGTAATGCCNAATALDPDGVPPSDPGTEAAGDWVRLWPDLRKAIDACLADVPADVDTVVKAWPMNRGRSGVRLAGADGQRFDCIVIDGANSVEKIEPIAADAPALPGERAPVLLPSQGKPPRVTCGRRARVMDNRGAAAGSMHDQDGCPGH
jgi:uncharacterized membrane protein